MALISTIRINQTSSYEVRIVDDGLSLGFTTEKGIRYKIAFTEDYNIFPQGAYMFYIGAQDMPFGRDRRIADTVYAVLGSFFEDNSRILLYFCDMKDHKQALRNRLFNMWYENFPRKDLFRKITRSIEVETDVYFVSLITSCANPEIEQISDRFDRYVNELKSK